MVTITNALKEKEKIARPYIEKYAKQFELDPNLIRALITQESRFVANAVSPTGAFGYGQFTTIGASQVRQVSQMFEPAKDLVDFTKNEASDPDRGIKAICAFLWWLLYRKYPRVADKKVQLEAALTFYNSGGTPAALVVSRGGFAEALPAIKKLPANVRSQADKYAPEVSMWYVAWHEYMKEEEKATNPKSENVPAPNPFDAEVRPAMKPSHRAVVEALKNWGESDAAVAHFIHSREGSTEITLIIPGEI